MPYETKLSRDAIEWMTLSQAVHYVASDENFHFQNSLSQGSSKAPGANSFVTVKGEGLSFNWTPHPPHLDAALNQVLLALQDEEIPIKWAAEQRPTHWPLHRDLLFALDDPPTGRYFWSTAIIVPSDDYAVLDHMIQLGALELDGVETNQDRGLRILLLLRSRVHELWPKKTRDTLDNSHAKKTSASLDTIRNAARTVYQKLDRPNVEIAANAIQDALSQQGLTAKRVTIRTMLREPEFQSQRRLAGNSKAKR